MSGIRWTQEEYEQHIGKFKTPNYPAVPVADVESNSIVGPAAKDEDKKIHPQFRIHYHSKRRRLCDPDGLYSKASTDGLTVGGILPDDNAAIVESIAYSQLLVPKTEGREETIIEVWEILK